MLEINKIYQGDCLELMKKLEDNSVDCIITDPPYGINYQSNVGRQGIKLPKIKSDDNPDWSWWIKKAYRVLKNNSHAYFFTRFDVYPTHFKNLQDVGFNIKQVLCIQKGSGGTKGDLNGSFSSNSEWVIFCHKGRKEFEKTNLVKTDGRVGSPEYRTRLPTCWFGKKYPQSTVNVSNQPLGFVHPTEKNVKLIRYFLYLSSKPNDIVLDPFIGSGTTAIACKQLNRKFIGIELNPRYVAIANKRLAQKQLMECLQNKLT